MCPVCREPMIAYQLEGVEIDRCLECGGTWLDAGELETLAELADADLSKLARALEEQRGARRTDRRCPRCPRRLREFRLGERDQVEIDRCPGNHGLWFDRGEMAAVIHAYATGKGGAVAGFFAELYRSESGSISQGE